jgi:hypothetical protein
VDLAAALEKALAERDEYLRLAQGLAERLRQVTAAAAVGCQEQVQEAHSQNELAMAQRALFGGAEEVEIPDVSPTAELPLPGDQVQEQVKRAQIPELRLALGPWEKERADTAVENAVEVATQIEVCTTCMCITSVPSEGSPDPGSRCTQSGLQLEASKPANHAGKVVRVNIVSAEGLQSEISSLYCLCWIRGKPHTKAETTVIDNLSRPVVWNFEHTLLDYLEGDTLVFTVYGSGAWKRDAVVGSAMLPSNKFRFQPYQGALPLSGGVSLTIRVVVLDELPAPQQPLAASRAPVRPLAAPPVSGPSLLVKSSSAARRVAGDGNATPPFAVKRLAPSTRQDAAAPGRAIGSPPGGGGGQDGGSGSGSACPCHDVLHSGRPCP